MEKDPTGEGFWGQVFGGELYEGETSWLGTAGEVVVGLIPIVGQGADIRDTAGSMRKIWRGERGGWLSLVASGVGWVPGAGDSLKGFVKGGRQAAKASAEVAQGAARELSQAAARNADEIMGAGRRAAQEGGQATRRTTKELGQAGEEAARRTMLKAGYGEMPARLPGNKGFDGVFVKRGADGSVSDIVVTESKFSSTGRASVSRTKTKGRQMSEEWIDATIEEMVESGDEAVQETGRLLRDKRRLIRREGNILDPQGVNRWNRLKMPTAREFRPY